MDYVTNIVWFIIVKDPLIPSKLSKESFSQLEEDIRNFTRR